MQHFCRTFCRFCARFLRNSMNPFSLVTRSEGFLKYGENHRISTNISAKFVRAQGVIFCLRATQMSTQPPCSGAEGSAGKSSTSIRLTGGHAEKPRIIAAYRAGQHVDVEVHSADGTAYRAHGLVLMAGSDYFDAAYNGGWADALRPHVLGAVPTDALESVPRVDLHRRLRSG